MHKAARRVSRGSAGTPRDLSNLSRFSVSKGGVSGLAADFVLEARESTGGALEKDETLRRLGGRPERSCPRRVSDLGVRPVLTSSSPHNRNPGPQLCEPFVVVTKGEC